MDRSRKLTSASGSVARASLAMGDAVVDGAGGEKEALGGREGERAVDRLGKETHRHECLEIRCRLKRTEGRALT